MVSDAADSTFSMHLFAFIDNTKGFGVIWSALSVAWSLLYVEAVYVYTKPSKVSAAFLKTATKRCEKLRNIVKPSCS